MEDETAWLLGFVNQVVLGGGQDCVLQSGSAIGVVLGWLFHRGQTGEDGVALNIPPVSAS